MHTGGREKGRKRWKERIYESRINVREDRTDEWKEWRETEGENRRMGR